MRIAILIGLLFLLGWGDAEALEYRADVNRGACSTNYSRLAPGVCYRTNGSSILLGIFAVGCNSKDVSLSVPTNATALLINVSGVIRGGNAALLRGFSADFHTSSDTTCASSNLFSSLFEIREFVATTTILGSLPFGIITYPILSTSQYLNINITEVNTGDFSSLPVTLVGYTD